MIAFDHTPLPNPCRFPSPPPEPVGYRVERELARGGMGGVWLALRLRDGKPFTIKAPRPDPALVARFHREGRLLQRMRHPNVLPVVETGGCADRPYFVAPYYQRGSLACLMCRGPVEARRAVALILGVVRGLRHAHERGIIHRDIKPANILCRSSRTLVLADWGLARCLGEGSDLTGSGRSMGTHGFMAPEQEAGLTEQGGKAADVFAVGRVLDGLVRGWGRPVPASLAAVISCCLAEEPRRRYPDAAALEAGLRRALAR